MSGTSLKGFAVCSRVFNGGMNSQNGGRFSVLTPKDAKHCLNKYIQRDWVMRIFPSVILVSGEINFNFGRSAFFLSKSEVKITNLYFIIFKHSNFINVIYNLILSTIEYTTFLKSFFL